MIDVLQESEGALRDVQIKTTLIVFDVNHPARAHHTNGLDGLGESRADLFVRHTTCVNDLTSCPDVINGKSVTGVSRRKVAGDVLG